MKPRQPLPARSKPLERGNPPKRTRLRRKRPDPARSARWRKIHRFVKGRSGGRCEARVEGVCTGAGEHLHHVIPRGRGGPDDEWNLLDVCSADHAWIHANPERATELGLLRSRHP